MDNPVVSSSFGNNYDLYQSIPLSDNDSLYKGSESKIDTLITYEKEASELVRNLKIQKLESDIQMSSVISSLKQLGYDFENCVIYYINSDDYYVNCWYDPVPESYTIPSTSIINSNKTDRIRLFIKKIPIENDDSSDGSLSTGGNPKDSKTKRSKERTIKDVKNKVDHWKCLCKKLKEEQPSCKKISERASLMVGIPKKSLDDYMHQIKLGESFNFDFEKHGCDKIGTLRQFNKKESQRKKQASRRSIKCK